MPKARSTKRDIDKAKRDKAALKRERRQSPRPDGVDEDGAIDGEVASESVSEPVASEADVLSALSRLHDRFDAGEVDFDEFEEAKGELIARLSAG